MRTSLEARAARGPKVVMAALLLSAPALRAGATSPPAQPASAAPVLALRAGAEARAEGPATPATPAAPPAGRPSEPALAPLALAAVSAMALVVGRRRPR